MFWQNEEFAAGLGRDMQVVSFVYVGHGITDDRICSALDGVVCVVDAMFGKKVRSSSDKSYVRLLITFSKKKSKWRKITL